MGLIVRSFARLLSCWQNKVMKIKTWEDPIVVELRKVKERLAAKFNFDVVAMLRDQQEREKRYGSRLVSFEPRRKANKTKVKTPQT